MGPSPHRKARKHLRLIRGEPAPQSLEPPVSQNAPEPGNYAPLAAAAGLTLFALYSWKRGAWWGLAAAAGILWLGRPKADEAKANERTRAKPPLHHLESLIVAAPRRLVFESWSSREMTELVSLQNLISRQPSAMPFLYEVGKVINDHITFRSRADSPCAVTGMIQFLPETENRATRVVLSATCEPPPEYVTPASLAEALKEDLRRFKLALESKLGSDESPRPPQ